MVLGYETPYHIVSMVASLITAVGILIIFANVMLLIRERDPRDIERTVWTGTNWLVLSIGGATVLLIGAAALYFVGTAHP
jgi:hypothetical protein